jgi:hypothetical protein
MAKNDDDFVSGLLGGHRGKYSPEYRYGENTRKTIDAIFKPMSQASQAPSYTPPRASYAGGSSSGSGSKARGGFFALLIVIGVLYAMAHSGGDKKQTAATQSETEPPASPPAEQPTSRATLTPSYADNSAASQPPAASGFSSPALQPNELAARNPDTPGNNVGSPVQPTQTDATPSADGWRRFGDSTAVPSPPLIPTAPPVSSYRPMIFAEAKHKGRLACTGELDLTSAGLHFSCRTKKLSQIINAPINKIERLDGDGVRLKTGEKYHFAVDNEDMKDAFQTWWTQVHQPQQ